VPSVLQSSVPASSVVATKKILLPNEANSCGEDDFVSPETVVLMSLTRYGVCAAAETDRRRRRKKGLRMGRIDASTASPPRALRAALVITVACAVTSVPRDRIPAQAGDRPRGAPPRSEGDSHLDRRQHFGAAR